MIIAFSGNDGSGKTTLCKTLLEELKKKGISAEYRHEYDYVFLKWLFKLLGNRFVNKQRDQFFKDSDTEEKRKSSKSNFIGTVWRYLVWMDNLMTVYYYKICYRKKIIILDRYPYDMYLSFQYLGKGSKVLESLFYSIPKADLQIIFFATPVTAYERKKDTHTYGLDFYETQLERYKNVASRLKIEMHNTEEPLAESVKFIFQRLMEKSPEWLQHELQRN